MNDLLNIEFHYFSCKYSNNKMGVTNHLRKLRISALMLAYIFLIGKILLLGVDINSLYSLTISYFIVPNNDKSESFINYNQTLFPDPIFLFIYGCVHTFLMSVDTVVGLVAVVGVHLKHKRLLETFFVTALATFVLNFVILFVALYRNENNYDTQAWTITAVEIIIHRALSFLCITAVMGYYCRMKRDQDRRKDSEIMTRYVEHIKYNYN